MNHARVAFLGALIILGSACSQTSPSAQTSPAPGTLAGNLIPAQLQGDWVLQVEEASAIAGSACPAPPAIATCTFRLTFTPTTYNWSTNVTGFSGGGGDVVVNGAEMDFFNGEHCGEPLPGGVGRYGWILSGGTLHFTSLNSDSCPRKPYLANQTYDRSS